MSTETSTTEMRAAVAAAARRIADAGLVLGTSGNVSARLHDKIVITATGAVLAQITEAEVSVIDLEGNVLEGDYQPTSEIDLHLGIYRNSALRAGGVVHCHAPNATALACVLDELPVIHYEQLMLGGAIRVAPFATFGTPDLADKVVEALTGRKAALMANHGAIAFGSDLGKAVENALLLEWMSTLYSRASAIGTPRALSIEQMTAVAEHAFKTNYGQTKRR